MALLANMSAVGISSSWVCIVALRGWGAVDGVSNGFADRIGERWITQVFGRRGGI
jgi:hypothetical protein